MLSKEVSKNVRCVPNDVKMNVSKNVSVINHQSVKDSEVSKTCQTCHNCQKCQKCHALVSKYINECQICVKKCQELYIVSRILYCIVLRHWSRPALLHS